MTEQLAEIDADALVDQELAAIMNTVAAHEASVESISVATTVDEAAEDIHTRIFTRSHGGKEFSGTIEQARKLCPALGAMSVENAVQTLQEEDLASKLARMGRERRLADAEKKTVDKAVSETAKSIAEATKPEPTAAKPAAQKTTQPERVLPAAYVTFT